MVYPSSPQSIPEIPFKVQINSLQQQLLHLINTTECYDFFKVYNTFMDLLTQTRFGSRFLIEPLYDVPFALPLNFTKLHVERTSLVEMLNSVFGVPSLFFGGSLLPQQEKIPKLLTLPHFLVFLFKRFDGSLNTTTIEITMDLDMGKFMDPLAIKPTHKHGYRGSPTFYKLHGFITQKGGMYMTYSRVRSGGRWFRFQDLQVESCELGVSIESKGMVLALYRLQDF